MVKNKIARGLLPVVTVFLLALFPVFSLAQQHPFHAGINYGVALPMGQFASHDFKRDSVEYGAYAMLGSVVSGEGCWYFTERLAVTVNASMGYYPIATGYYLVDKDADDPAADNFKMKSGPWTIKTLMLGLTYRYPLSDKFSMRLKGFGGLFQADSPEQFYSANYFGLGTFSWWKTSARSNRYTFLAGTGITYALFDHVNLNLDAEFTYARAEFHFWDVTYTYRTTKHMRIPLFKLQPGLSITF